MEGRKKGAGEVEGGTEGKREGEGGMDRRRGGGREGERERQVEGFGSAKRACCRKP